MIFKTSRTVTGGKLPGAETRLRPARKSILQQPAVLNIVSMLFFGSLDIKGSRNSRRPTEPLEFSINSLIWSAFGSPDTFLVLRATTLVWSLNVFVKI